MYSFQLSMPIDGSQTPLQVVYPSHEDSDDRLATSLEQLVEAYNVRVPPSRLLFICPTGIDRRIRQSFSHRKDEFEGRLKSTSHVIVAPYDERGKLIDDGITPLIDPETNWEVDDCFLERLGVHAVSQIFNDTKTKTILHTPHGYLFRHPSGREEDIFVRAGNMLRDPSCLAVFNHVLLRKLPPDCSSIYIDSFTILSFALGLQSLVGYFHRSECSVSALDIENIHSYEVTSEFRFPDEPNYLVLISASTSGGFADKLVEEKNAIRNRIVHLLGAGPPESDLRNSCVYFWDRPRRPSRPISGASQQNALIDIGAEEFLVAQGHPRPVAITRAHVNRDGARKLHDSYYREALKFHGPAPVPGGAYSTFTVSTEYGDSICSPMRPWVYDCLVHELPASVHTLVYVEDRDRMSAVVASWLHEALGNHVVTKSLDELIKAPPASGSVVVVAYQDPGLELLRQSSVALRSMEGVHRHYVVGYAFPSSFSEHDRLKDDLCMGRNGPQQYGWSEYLVLPVGADTVHESLVRSIASVDADTIEQRRGKLGDSLADALIAWERWRSSGIPSDGLFLPRTNGDPLCLRHGSVFFDPPTACISQIAVHAMVSAAMQAAREPGVSSGLNRAPPNPGFDENPFVRSVLDPSMFARYSDGILQASLLRTARRSELDYSSSDELSRQFASVCDYILDSHDHDVGEAALEFVHALATEKVSLRSEDRDCLRKKICCVPVLASFWGLLRQEPCKPFKLKVITKRGWLMPGVDIDDRDALYRVMEER